MKKFYALLLMLLMLGACTKQKCNNTAQMQLTVTPNTLYIVTIIKNGQLYNQVMANTTFDTYNIESVVFGDYKIYVRNAHLDSFSVTVDKCIYKMDVRQ